MNLRVAITAFLVGLSISAVAFAQDGGVGAAAQEAAQKAADKVTQNLRNCSREFLTVITGTGGGFIDAIASWQDIFQFNSCYRADLDGTSDQLRKIRHEMRAAYLRCDMKNKERVVQNYYKADAELWFLRSAIDTKNGRLIEQFLGPENKQRLKKVLAERYGEKIPDQLLDQYVSEFQVKYRDRMDGYRTCPTFAKFDEVGEKWDEFVAALEDIAKFFRGDDENEREKQREKEREGTKTPDQAGPRDGPIASFEEGLDLNLKIARLQVEPEGGLENLIQRFKDDFSTTPPIGKIQGLVQNEKRRVSEEMTKGETWVRYRETYGKISDASITDIKASLQELNSIIESSTPALEQAKECTEKVRKIQCSEDQH